MKQIKSNFGANKAMIGVFCLLPLTEGCNKNDMFSKNQTASVGPCELKLLEINTADVKLEISAKSGSFKRKMTVPYDTKVSEVDRFHCPFTIYKPTAGEPKLIEYVILQK